MKRTLCRGWLPWLSLLVFAVPLSSEAKTNYTAGTLDAERISVADVPDVDGSVDAVWGDATELVVPMGETADITSCASCHGFDSGQSVSLKAVYTAERVYMLASWPDTTASLTRGGAWTWADTAWQKHDGDQSEDRIAFMFPTSAMTGDVSNVGCMAKCHTADPGSWLTAGTADMWHTKAGRSGPVVSIAGSGLTVDSTTNEVTAGTLSMVGYADDKNVGADGGSDRGRYGDAGTSTYAHNRIGDASRPKYMETAPDDYADAMVLTQSEIDDGEVIGNDTTGVDSASAATAWIAYAAVNAIVPERILRLPTGSRGDIDFGASWTDGVWTVELGRDLDTGNGDDVMFDPADPYHFNIATMDNGGGGAEHRVSAGITLAFTAQPAPGTADPAGGLQARRVSMPDEPDVDGVLEGVWDNAAKLTVPMGGTTDITLCASCHGFDSGNSVDLQAVYSTDRFYMAATWDDPTASLTRGGSWTWEADTWQKLDGDQSEDRIAFMFPISAMSGEYTDSGCMAKCHTTDAGSWLEGGTADMWHTKAARSGGVVSVSSSGTTVDATTNELTGGTINLIGYADDKNIGPDAGAGTDRGRYGDAGSSTYGHNRIPDKSRPMFMEKALKDYADAMVLTQAEIDAGEAIGDTLTGVSDFAASIYWQNYASRGAVVPERILRAPVGSRGDIEFGAKWSNGTWTVELGRDMNTGNADDIQFDPANSYGFNIATMDNGGGGAEHETSGGINLSFSSNPAGVMVMDVPNDQGRRVTVRWDAAIGDRDIGSVPLYSIWRALPAGAPKVAGARYRVAALDGMPMDWEWIADQRSLRLPSYSYTAETLFDQRPEVDGTHHFMVVTHTADPDEFYKSDIGSGHSVDNLAPVPPGPAKLVANNVVWSPSPDNDVMHYAVYRQIYRGGPGFSDTPYLTTVDTSFAAEWPYRFGISAIDFGGNESEMIEIAVPNGIGGDTPLPTSTALLGNAPNPFNPETAIRYQVHAEANVSISVYNARGQHVRTLVAGNVGVGRHSVIWDAKDSAGYEVASGLYIYSMTTNTGTRDVRRMLLVR